MLNSTVAPVVAMQIVYKNDSVTNSCMKRIFESGIQGIRLQSDTMTIREIKEFIFYLQSQKSITPLVSDTSLTRYHVNDSLTQMGKDSLDVDSVTGKNKVDSIRKKTPQDTIQVTPAYQQTNPKDLNRLNNDVRPVKPEQREKEQRTEKGEQQLEGQ